MDMKAYALISSLQPLCERNGIDIPRVRGYRLMGSEDMIIKESIKKVDNEMSLWIVHNLCISEEFWDPNATCFILDSKDRTKKYLRKNYWEETCKIQWDRIHGRKRKILKFEIKKVKRKIRKQFDTFNKYVGDPDILMIHARIGGSNWNDYGGAELEKQPWFIERVDDYFDSTYCDIYARLDQRLIDHIKEEYYKSDNVMTEFLRSFNPELPEWIRKELLEWSGEQEYEE